MLGTLEGLAFQVFWARGEPQAAGDSAEPAPGNPALAQLGEAAPPDGGVRLGPQQAGKDRAGWAGPAASCSLHGPSPAPPQHRGCGGLGSSLRRIGAGAGRNPVTDAAQRSRGATFFVHYQEKDGAERRLNSEATEFTFISPKVVSMSDSRKSQSLDLPERTASTVSSRWAPSVHEETTASSREARRGVGVQLPKVLPLGPLPAALSSPAGCPLSFHGWDLGRGLLPGSQCLGGPHDGGDDRGPRLRS